MEVWTKPPGAANNCANENTMIERCDAVDLHFKVPGEII
jgi:hypothetical protein